MLVIALLACSDYSFQQPEDVGEGGEARIPHDTGADEDLPPSYEEPPTGQPPSFLDGDCTADDEAWFDFDEIYVKSWDLTLNTGVVVATAAGWYHVYDLGMAESGQSQTNETAAVRIKNDTNPQGFPAWGNCGDDWFVRDADNSSTPTQRLYSGTFWLDEGDNDLELIHYCPTFRAGQCENLHISDWSDGTCDSSNPNSVHLVGEAACILPAQ